MTHTISIRAKHLTNNVPVRTIILTPVNEGWEDARSGSGVQYHIVRGTYTHVPMSENPSDDNILKYGVVTPDDVNKMYPIRINDSHLV